MTQDDGGAGASQRLDRQYAVFVGLADRMAMPQAERAGILGVAEDDLALGVVALRPREAEALRRLIYAIPLMQRQLESFF